MALTVHLACGGTGGHIFPGLATAEVLKRRGHSVTLWLAGKDVESTAVSGWDGPVITVRAEGLSGGQMRKLRSAGMLIRATVTSFGRMHVSRPDVLLAMGSYASFGPVVAALRHRVPVVLHESNVIPGRAISMLSRWAKNVGAVFEETRFYLKQCPLTITGMPLRREVVEGAARPRAERKPGDPFTVLVMGGSRGARRLNEMVTEAASLLKNTPGSIRFIHLAGVSGTGEVRRAYEAAGVAHEVQSFSTDMASLYARADLAICRSGAATCAELLVHRLPALLVPYPYAARHHQHANAQAMVRYGAADLVDEKDLECEWLAQYLTGMMRAEDRRKRMSAAALQHARTDAAAALADVVEAAARSV